MTSEQELHLQTLTAETLGVDPEEITDAASPQTLEAWTSFSHLMLMSAVEGAFSLTFSMEEMVNVHDYAGLRTLVTQRLSER